MPRFATRQGGFHPLLHRVKLVQDPQSQYTDHLVDTLTRGRFPTEVHDEIFHVGRIVSADVIEGRGGVLARYEPFAT